MNVGEKIGLLPKAEYECEDCECGLRVTRTSIFTRQRNSMELPITRRQLLDYSNGCGLVQDIFPELDADQREFLMSGATPEEWAGIFGGEDD